MNWQNRILVTLAFLSVIWIPISALAIFLHAKYKAGLYGITYKTTFYSEVEEWIKLIKAWEHYDG